MYRWGIVSAVRLSPVPGCKVRFPEDDVVTAYLPVLQLLTFGAKVTALPRPGALVAVLVGEDPTDGLVLGGAFNALDTPPSSATLAAVVVELESGMVLKLDPATNGVTITGADLVDVVATGKIRLDAPALELVGDVEIQGDGTVSGNWTVAGNTSAHHTHPVSGGVAQRGD